MADKERIRNAVDEIEIPSGARERMLANIKEKAELQKTEEIEPLSVKQKKKPALIRMMRWALPVAACFVLVFVGVKMIPNLVDPKQPIDTNPNEQIATPFLEVASADDIKDKIGITMNVPQDATEVSYYVLDGEIGEISFQYNGHSYYVRASRQSGDFSGLNGTVIYEEKIDAKYDALLTVIDGGGEQYRKISWTDGGATYYILANTDDSESDVLKAIYEKIEK